jgi:ABC-type lipoprotein export system ATPase subunit
MPLLAPLLKLASVTRRYDAPGKTEALTVLAGVSLEIARGESLAIVGPSGSGKSTLLQIMGTLDRPTSGSVTLDGRELGALDELQLASVRNRQIGFVFQSHYLLPQCTVMENVLVPTLPARMPRCATALAAGRSGFWNVWDWDSASPIAPANSPAASASGWRWSAR